jgi:hypothetical protein
MCISTTTPNSTTQVMGYQSSKLRETIQVTGAGIGMLDVVVCNQVRSSVNITLFDPYGYGVGDLTLVCNSESHQDMRSYS